MITLTEKWCDPRGGITFPVGTVFIPRHVLAKDRGTVYTYGTPGGGHGETRVAKGMVPGGSSS
jgi:hypothetical protein